MMNSKQNRQIRPKKSLNTPKAEQPSLKGETSKIQNKLESLKAQIAMRKTMKNKQKQSEPLFKATQNNNTGQSWNTNSKGFNQRSNLEGNNEKVHKFLLGSSKQLQNNQEVSQDRLKLTSLLEELKMEQYREAIEKYGVTGLQKLLDTKEEDIDEWKNIPVGFRVKLRKFINEHNRNREALSSSPQQKQSGENIEEIIKRRKTERVYEPICDKQLEEQDQEENPVQQQINVQTESEKKELDDEDILISSLNSAFLQRRGIIKKEGSTESINTSENRNKVQWDTSVKDFNKETSNFVGEKYRTKYPAHQGIKEEAYQVQGKEVAATYCWECLKKIGKVQQEDHRAFCSFLCKETYLAKTEPHFDLDNDNVDLQKPLAKQTNYGNQQSESEDLDFDLL